MALFFFKSALRNLLRNKAFSIINLLGLATGIAVCLLLTLYIQNDLGYDGFHQNGDQIYRLALERKYPGRTAFRCIIPGSIGQAIKNEFPEVLESVRVMPYASSATTIQVDDKVVEDKLTMIADANFFSVFAGDFISGDKYSALTKPGTAVINESTAKRLFGSSEKIVGRFLKINGSQDVLISGVCKDWPKKSHLQFNILLSWSSFSNLNQPNYYDLITCNYLLLHKGASAKVLESKLPQIIVKYVSGTIEKGFGQSFDAFSKEGNGYRYFLQPLKDIHLYSHLDDELNPNSSMSMIYLLTAIGIFILFLACINFINLSTASSVERAREVGIRKTFGSNKRTLVWQFLTESVALTGISLILAILLARLLLPVLNNVSGSTIQFAYFYQIDRIAFILLFGLLIGIAAGVYPAWVISSFKPIIVLKGHFKSSSRGGTLRNTLVVFQFTISIILLFCTVILHNQMQFVLGGSLGFASDHIVSINDLARLSKTNQKAFINEIATLAGVDNWSQCTDLPVVSAGGFDTFTMQTVDSHQSRTQKTIFTDERYLNLFGLSIKEGRFFSKDFTTDSLAVVLNESAVKDFGLLHPIGTRLVSTEPIFNSPDGKRQTVYTVTGVVKDYHFESLHEKIAPLIIVNSVKFGATKIGIRLKGKNLATTIGNIENSWKKFGQKEIFRYSFLDQSLEAQYKSEQTHGKMFTIFSILAIFIACIGLFGLSTYTTWQRTKEIGIRKVLGASVETIVFNLSKDFMKLILWAIVVAYPIAFWGIQEWLQNFAYRVTISWWLYLVPGLGAFLVAIFTISFQTIKAALANPVKSFRNN